MRTIVVAVALGALLGALVGGWPPQPSRRRFRHLEVLGVGLGLQVVPDAVELDDTAAGAMVVASYLVLAWFAVANLRVVGMPVALAGLAMNALVVGLNQGMPVRPAAVEAAGGDADPAEDLGSKRHWEDGDRLAFLGDVVPVRPLAEVVSFGDLVLAAGAADVAFRLLRPLRGSRRVAEDEPQEIAAP